MNLISRTITGIILIALGVCLFVLGLKAEWWVVSYGIGLFVVGIFIFFNKKEDEIEQIKNKQDQKDKK